MKNVCEKEICTGCYSCVNSCPFNAIEMVTDELGFIYPKIDSSKCKDCGICKKRCPQINETKKKYPLAAYAMYLKDVKDRETSTSGGVAASLYEYIIENNGVVYGVSSYFINKKIEFIRVTSKTELKKLKGSKYVHAYIKNIFNYVKKDLKSNKKVLFVGTPCQIAGLKFFLVEDYENLYTVDLICHGVSSQHLLFDELELNNLSSVDSISFRDNKGYNLICYNKEKEILSVPCRKNNYYRNFLAGNICRKSCYSCKYANIERISDLTIGDFWGLHDNCKIKDDETKGISLVMPITEKGKFLLDVIKGKMQFEERPIQEAENGNSQLKAPINSINKRIKFEQEYLKNGYFSASKKMITMKDRFKANDLIYLTYQKIKKILKRK